MDYIKQWTISICMTLIVAVILSFISPSGTMGKFYKTIISLFILSGFLIPLANANIKDFDFPSAAFSQTADTQSVYEKQIEAWIKSSLEQGGYPACSVKAQVQLKDDEIYIDTLQISAPSDYDLQAIQTYIFDNLGLQAEVRRIGD